jgi:hypothetical protein
VRPLFEDRHVVSVPQESASNGKAADTGSDDEDALFRAHASQYYPDVVRTVADCLQTYARGYTRSPDRSAEGTP